STFIPLQASENCFSPSKPVGASHPSDPVSPAKNAASLNDLLFQAMIVVATRPTLLFSTATESGNSLRVTFSLTFRHCLSALKIRSPMCPEVVSDHGNNREGGH